MGCKSLSVFEAKYVKVVDKTAKPVRIPGNSVLQVIICGCRRRSYKLFRTNKKPVTHTGITGFFAILFHTVAVSALHNAIQEAPGWRSGFPAS